MRQDASLTFNRATLKLSYLVYTPWTLFVVQFTMFIIRINDKFTMCAQNVHLQQVRPTHTSSVTAVQSTDA